MDAIEAFTRAHGSALRWIIVAAWVAASLGAFRLSLDKRCSARGGWLVVAILCLGFALETAHPLRFALTGWLREELRTLGGDEAVRNRRPLQLVVIASVIVPLLVLVAVRIVRTEGISRPGKIGLLGAGIGSTGLVLETISWHYLDQNYFYRALRFAGLGLVLYGVGSGLMRTRSRLPLQTPRWVRPMTVSDPLPAQVPVWVWGVPFVPWTLSRTVDEVERLIGAGGARYFMTVNLHTAMLVSEDPAVRAAVDGAAFVVADGMPLVWASRVRGPRLPERVTGADLFPALCARAAQKGYRVFFLGGPPGVGAAAAENLSARFPGLQVVGTESPPYRPLTAREEGELLDRVRGARPHLVFVSFSQPKGELWTHQNSSALSGAVCVNIGAALDFAAGRIRRAPRWMQRTGLEWMYRLAREPRRLFTRYARNAAFVARMLLTELTNRNRRRNRPDT